MPCNANHLKNPASYDQTQNEDTAFRSVTVSPSEYDTSTSIVWRLLSQSFWMMTLSPFHLPLPFLACKNVDAADIAYQESKEAMQA